MAKLNFKNGITSVILRIAISDITSFTGEGLSGLAYNSSGLVISTIADNEATATTYTAAGSTIETISTLGTFAAPTATKCRFKEVDATNHKGLYEVQIADARWAVSGARSVIIEVYGATNAARVRAEVQLMVAGDGWAIADANSRVDVSKIEGTDATDQIRDSVVSDATRFAGADVATIKGFIDTEVAAIKAKTDNLPSDPADASDIASSFSTVNSTLATIAAYIDTEVAAIKAKTDNLPPDPADASDIAASFSSLASTLSTIAGYIDTEIATLIDAAARMLGLQGKHVRLESPTYDGDGNILTYTLNVYDTGAHATAGGATGLLYQYSVTNTYSSGNLATSVTTQVT